MLIISHPDYGSFPTAWASSAFYVFPLAQTKSSHLRIHLKLVSLFIISLRFFSLFPSWNFLTSSVYLTSFCIILSTVFTRQLPSIVCPPLQRYCSHILYCIALYSLNLFWILLSPLKPQRSKVVSLKCVLWSRSYTFNRKKKKNPVKLSHEDVAYCKLHPFKCCLCIFCFWGQVRHFLLWMENNYYRGTRKLFQKVLKVFMRSDPDKQALTYCLALQVFAVSYWFLWISKKGNRKEIQRCLFYNWMMFDTEKRQLDCPPLVHLLPTSGHSTALTSPSSREGFTLLYI